MFIRHSVIPVVLIVLIASWGCNKKKTEETGNPIPQNSELTVSEHLKASEIITSVCENCHDPSSHPDDRLAPPLEIAKRNYLEASSSKDEFVEMITNFILAPDEEKAKLHSDIEEFGLMDPIGYSEEEIRLVAIYIYETELEKPDWLK